MLTHTVTMRRKLSTQKVNLLFSAVQSNAYISCILNMVFLLVDRSIIRRPLFYYDSCDKDIFSFY